MLASYQQVVLATYHLDKNIYISDNGNVHFDNRMAIKNTDTAFPWVRFETMRKK